MRKSLKAGTYRVALHTATGALAGGLPGAAGAASTAVAASALNGFQDALVKNLEDAGLSPTLATATATLIGSATATGLGLIASGGNNIAAATALNADANNRQLHQDQDPRKDERTRIEQDVAPAYAAAHPGMTVEEATQILVDQLLRQVDTTAAAEGGWNQDAANYLNSYAAAHIGEIVGTDQWGNAVPLFKTVAGYQRNDSTIFSATPQTTTPPPNLGWETLKSYYGGMGDGLGDTLLSPWTTLKNSILGIYNLVTDPVGTAQQMQDNAREIYVQAGDGNFAPAGRQVGQQIGTTAVDSVALAVGGVVTGKIVSGVKGGTAGMTAAESAGARFTYNAVENPGPLASLPGNPAANFISGKYNASVLTDDLVLYRGGEAGTPLGQWFTREAPASVAQVRIESAVKPQWIDPIESRINT